MTSADADRERAMRKVAKRAWRRTREPFELTELDLVDTTPGDGRVVIAVEAAATAPWTATPEGRVPGVAAVGLVVATGGATDEWLGARVIVPSHAPCGECELCRRGGAVLCPTGTTYGIDGPGALATHMTAAARWLCRIDDRLAIPGPDAAALGGEIAFAYALYARAGIDARAPTIIWGRGALARLCAVILAAKGAPALVATDDERLAAVAGSTFTTVAADPALVTAAMASHGARPRKVIVTEPEFLAPALAAAGPRAMVVVAVGADRRHTGPTLLTALDHEVTIASVAGCHPDLVPELAAITVRGDLILSTLVETTPLAGLTARLAARSAAPPPTTLVAVIAD